MIRLSYIEDLCESLLSIGSLLAEGFEKTLTNYLTETDILLFQSIEQKSWNAASRLFRAKYKEDTFQTDDLKNFHHLKLLLSRYNTVKLSFDVLQIYFPSKFPFLKYSGYIQKLKDTLTRVFIDNKIF